MFSDKERFIRIAYSYINDMEMATVLCTCWEHRNGLDCDVNIKGYIYDYVKTRCISYLRKRKSILKVQSELYKKEQWRIESSIKADWQTVPVRNNRDLSVRSGQNAGSHPQCIFGQPSEDMTYHQIAEKFNLTIQQVPSEI